MEESCHISGVGVVKTGVDADSERVLPLPAESVEFDFEAVFREQYSRIARVVARLVQDSARAEDIATEVFWKLYCRPSAHGPHAAGWLYRTAVRAGLDELRKRSRRSRYEAASGRPVATMSPEQIYSYGERQMRVRTVLSAIKRRQAELLFMRSEGSSYQDIARALGLNPNSIGTLLRRAEDAFRKEYVRRYGSEW